MGRKTLLEKLGLKLEDIQSSYEELGKLEEVAKKYECSERTVRKYLDRAGVERKRGRKSSPDFGATCDTGCVGEWIRHHLGQRLPHSVRSIAKLTGCSKDEVKSYLYRKRNQVRIRFFIQENDMTQKILSLQNLSNLEELF